MGDDDLAVVALGFTTKAWYHLRGASHSVFTSGMGGNMGLAIGLALALPHRRVILLDTDGCQLMALSALCAVAHEAPDNLTVLVFDNESYAATGGQPTHTAFGADLASLARGAGVKDVATVADTDSFRVRVDRSLVADALTYTVVKVPPADHATVDERFDRVEAKFQYIRSIEAEEGIKILP